MSRSLVTILLILIVCGAIGVVSYRYGAERAQDAAISSFEECAAAGYPIMESYPPQCRTKSGKSFTQNVPPIEMPDETQNNTSTNGGCAVGGCSGQLCGEASDAPMASTCEFRAEYACYQGATCTRLSDGKCGWKETAELRACLNNPPPLHTDAGMEFPI